MDYRFVLKLAANVSKKVTPYRSGDIKIKLPPACHFIKFRSQLHNSNQKEKCKPNHGRTVALKDSILYVLHWEPVLKKSVDTQISFTRDANAEHIIVE